MWLCIPTFLFFVLSLSLFGLFPFPFGCGYLSPINIAPLLFLLDGVDLGQGVCRGEVREVIST